MEVSATKEQIIEASKKGKIQKDLLEALFPDVFELDKPFCKIGSVFTRPKYPQNRYAVFRMHNYIKVLNVTCSSFWDDSKSILLAHVKDQDLKTLTRGEFQKLMKGQESIDDIKFL